MDAPGHAFHIYDKDDRAPEDAGYMGRARQIRSIDAIEHAHDAFDHRNVRAFRGPGKGLDATLLTHHEWIKIPRRAPANPGMVRRVDKIRAHFEWLDLQAPCGKGSHDAACNGSLAAPAVGAGNKDPGNADHGPARPGLSTPSNPSS